MTTEVSPRRTPKQERSQARVEAILESARALIGSEGNDAVSVREIAAHAEVPIASVYQYFPSKTAILRQLLLRYYNEIAVLMLQSYEGVRSAPELLDANDLAIDALIEYFDDEPALTNILAGAQANPTLRELDAADTLEKASFLAALAQPLFPGADEGEVLDVCLFAATVVAHIAGLAAATSDPEIRTRLVRELKTLLRLRVASLRLTPGET